MTSLFGQATPGGTITSGAGNAGTNGLHFTVSAAATLEGIWHYSPSGSTQLPTTIALWTTQAAPSTGTLVTSNAATWLTGPGGSAASAGSGWVYAAFTSPPSLSSGVDYMAGQFRNDATNEWFCHYVVTWPVTSGVITAPADTGGVSANSQGWYVINAALTFPNGHSGTGGDNFGMDVEVSSGSAHTATAADTVTPSTSAARTHAATEAAADTITPSTSAARTHAATEAAADTITPSTSAAASRGHSRTAADTITPSTSAAASRGHSRTAADTVTPSTSAAATAAAGALSISIAAKSGNDPQTNTPYDAGVSLYGPNGQKINLALTGNALALNMTPPSMTQETSKPNMFALGDNPGAANETSLLVLSSGKENSRNDAAIQLWSETADGTGVAVVVFEFGGTIAARLTAAGLSSDTWHQASLINGWVGTGASGPNGIRYQVLPVGGGILELQGDLSNPTATGNSVACVLPAGFRPVLDQNFPAGWNNPQASNAASAPWVFVDPTGNVQITGIQTAGKGIFFHLLVPLT